jgi:hypothetical protein
MSKSRYEMERKRKNEKGLFMFNLTEELQGFTSGGFFFS